MTDDEEMDYGLIMPFVLCKTQGGELDDVSFTVGWELGQIDQELELCETLYSTPRGRYVHAIGIPQLDLIAMRRGFTLDFSEYEDEGEWHYVGFKRQESGGENG